MKTASQLRKLETPKGQDVAKINDLRASAGACFDRLARAAGLDPAQYKRGQEWIKDDANRLHIVQRHDAKGAPSVILKHAFRPENPDEFVQILAAHHQAHAALSANQTATVPTILAEDGARQAYLMEFIPGATFLNLCRDADDHAPYLRKAGAWIAAYHAGTFTETRPFQPKFMAQHMLHLVGQMERGERRINGQKKFIELAHHLQDQVADAAGYVGKIAAKHGDLNAHNLLISEDRTAAFDFLAQSNAPVAYDISRFLLSYMQMVGDIDQIPKGQVLPPEAVDAFWDGYSFTDRDDPTVSFLLKVQILTDWNRLSNRLNVQSFMRFQRLKKIARRAFA